MRLNRTWGDGNCLAAACVVYKRPIYVYTHGTTKPVVIDHGLQDVNVPHLTLGFVEEEVGGKPTHYVSLSPLIQTPSIPDRISLINKLAYYSNDLTVLSTLLLLKFYSYSKVQQYSYEVRKN